MRQLCSWQAALYVKSGPVRLLRWQTWRILGDEQQQDPASVTQCAGGVFSGGVGRVCGAGDGLLLSGAAFLCLYHHQSKEQNYLYSDQEHKTLSENLLLLLREMRAEEFFWGILVKT